MLQRASFYIPLIHFTFRSCLAVLFHSRYMSAGLFSLVADLSVVSVSPVRVGRLRRVCLLPLDVWSGHVRRATFCRAERGGGGGVGDMCLPPVSRHRRPASVLERPDRSMSGRLWRMCRAADARPPRAVSGGVLLNIECKAWAKNIHHDRKERRGSVHLELMVD